jgi:uncharacterized protein (DUF2336 family)
VPISVPAVERRRALTDEDVEHIVRDLLRHVGEAVAQRHRLPASDEAREGTQ